jgi:hypothetical protein
MLGATARQAKVSGKNDLQAVPDGAADGRAESQMRRANQAAMLAT